MSERAGLDMAASALQLKRLRRSFVLAFDDYELRHLAAHLVAAGRYDDLCRLLNLETREGRNAWYEAKVASDRSGSSYLTDVGVAWSAVARANIDAIRGGQPASDIGREMRYALVTASLRSRWANVPPNLLGVLVSAGVLPASQALTAIRQMPEDLPKGDALEDLAARLPSSLLSEALDLAKGLDSWARSKALPALTPRLPNSERLPLLRQALSDASAVDSSAVAERFAALAPQLPEPLLAEALDVAAAIKDEHSQMAALVALAPHLPEKLAEKALAVAREIRNEPYRVEAVAVLSDRLPKRQRSRALKEALAIVRSIESRSAKNRSSFRLEHGVWGTTTALVALAPHLSGSFFREAWDLASSIDSDFERHKAIEALAAYLPEPLLGNAISSARSVEDAACRAKTLTALAVRLSGPERMSLLFEARDAITPSQYPSPWQKAFRFGQRIAGKVAARLALPQNLVDVLEDLEILPEEGDRFRGEALVALTHYLPDRDRSVTTREVMEIASTIRDGEDRMDLVIKLAQALPESERTPVVRDARTRARAIREPDQRAKSLMSLIPLMPEADRHSTFKEILETIRLTDAQEERLEIIGEIIQECPQALLADLLAAAEAIGDGAQQATTMARLASSLAPRDRRRVLRWALASARTAPDALDRCRALGAVAVQLPTSKRQKLLREALATARQLHDWRTSWAIEHVAPFLPDSLFGAALAITREIQGGEQWRALMALAPRLPDSLVGEMRDMARQCRPPQDLLALLAVAPRLSPSDRQGLLHAALRSRPERKRASSTLSSAFQTGSAVENYERDNALAAVVPHLAPESLVEALAMARAVPVRAPKAKALAAIAARVPERERPQLVAEALSAARHPKTDGRADPQAIATVLPLLSGSERSRVLGEAFEAARADALDGLGEGFIALAPHLSLSELRSALDVVRAMPTQFRGATLAALAQHVPESERLPVLHEAFLAAPGMGSTGQRADVLSVIAPYCPHMDHAELYALCATGLHALAQAGRPELLSDLEALAPHLHALGGSRLIADISHAIENVARWWA
jgi:hypothetical protein